MTETTVNDLISLSYDQKPIEFQQAFNSLISGRIAQAVSDRKVEVAQNMFKAEEEVESDTITDTEETEDGEAA
jgi:hypothetical protein